MFQKHNSICLKKRLAQENNLLIVKWGQVSHLTYGQETKGVISFEWKRMDFKKIRDNQKMKKIFLFH